MSAKRTKPAQQTRPQPSQQSQPASTQPARPSRRFRFHALSINPSKGGVRRRSKAHTGHVQPTQQIRQQSAAPDADVVVSGVVKKRNQHAFPDVGVAPFVETETGGMKRAGQAVVTDAQGAFHIRLPAVGHGAFLFFSYPGFECLLKEIEVGDTAPHQVFLNKQEAHSDDREERTAAARGTTPEQA